MRCSPAHPANIPRRTGFTYIALLIIVALMGVASAATFAVGTTLQRREAEEELLFIGSQFILAFRSYYDATPPEQVPYPASLQELIRDPRFPETRRHLRKIYIDPITRKNDWVPILNPEGGIMGVHSSSTAAPIKLANFPEELGVPENRTSYAEWVFVFTAPSAGRPR